METSNEFALKCSDEGFLQRQKNVFDQLFKIEKTATETSIRGAETMIVEKKPNSIDVETKKSRKIPTKSFRGKESIFKMPQDPSPRHFLRRLPDYKKNPHKWTKYSLEDVKDEDISDKGNTKAALSFLKELNDRNDRNKEMNTDDASEAIPTRIIFQKHIVDSNSKETDNEDKPSFKSSKRVMPEYVVGQKIQKDKKKRAIKKINKKELKLDHLFEEDEGE